VIKHVFSEKHKKQYETIWNHMKPYETITKTWQRPLCAHHFTSRHITKPSWDMVLAIPGHVRWPASRSSVVTPYLSRNAAIRWEQQGEVAVCVGGFSDIHLLWVHVKIICLYILWIIMDYYGSYHKHAYEILLHSDVVLSCWGRTWKNASFDLTLLS
jgi:hypothetical protein